MNLLFERLKKYELLSIHTSFYKIPFKPKYIYILYLLLLLQVQIKMYFFYFCLSLI